METNENKSEIYNKMERLTEVTLYINDLEYVVKCEDIDSSTSLNFYLRNKLHMTGTKSMCCEGGCGACVVVLQKGDAILSVNSCLTPLLSCNGWRILTVENIHNEDGYHPIQEVLAKYNGTQCGFCSPGMVMNMYALYESGKLTMKEVENSFSGNICRCTGYRPILSAFKSLCTDADPAILGECSDIEDLRVCRKEKCWEKCKKTTTESFCIQFLDSKWVKVFTLKDLLKTIAMQPRSSYRLVAGNTGQGVYKSYKDNVNVYIDINDISELKVNEVQGDSYILGANNTLTRTMEFFKQTAEKDHRFAYLKYLADHMKLIANVPVRNRGTIAGNLMIKHDHHDFSSDIFLILETVGAMITIVDLSGKEIKLKPLDFINCDMKCMVLKNIALKAFPNTIKYISYKIMPRAGNTHAHLNSGFLFQFDENNLLEAATIVYGNINPKFVHAKQTENLLLGKNLFNNSVLQQVYRTLSAELVPNVIPPDPCPKFRKELAIALFYKAVISIAPSDIVSPKNKSGGTLLERPISKGAQDYETNKSLYPVSQTIPKIEALAQISGEAQYIDDIPHLPSQLFGALVLAQASPNSIIKKVDFTSALERKDIVAFYSKDDIPGDNNFTPLRPNSIAPEEIFCSGTVKYYEQPIGILIGKSQKAVDEAVGFVEVIFDPPKVEPVFTIRQILKRGSNDRIESFKTIHALRRGTDIKHIVKGTFDVYHQYHFHMETQICNVVPNENGLDVYASTQWMDLTQSGIARMLNIPSSKITVSVRRCGGSFGGKISRNGLVSCAAALASWKLKKPVKLNLPLTTNMVVMGKRWPFSVDYEVGVNNKGVIQYFNSDLYTDIGAIFSADCSPLIIDAFKSAYNFDTFTLNLKRAITDTPVNTWARAPGSTEGIGALESIMEHISYVVGIDPLELRVANLSSHTHLAKYIEDIKTWANIDQRKAEIQTFNKENRWKKKGLAVVPMNYDIELYGPYLVTVSIFYDDGSVQISHGGIEIGQGINTKVAQVCAYKLQIPLEKIIILPSSSFTSPNNAFTAASVTSEGVCYGVIQACDELLTRMKPYQSESSNWYDVLKKCQKNYVSLVATGKYSPKEPDVRPYSVYGVCATEVEVDILTGQHLIARVDLIEDTGVSLNPIIDIGQIEGAFIMGVGYYTMEKITMNSEGRILTNNTWTYHPPGPKDIPVDFRVKFPKNNPNPVGVLKSKATGEPALCLAISVPLAIRNALASARTDANGSNSKWYPIDGPSDVENVFLNSLNNYCQYIL